MKQSDAYKIALARAQANPVLIEAIGSPISQTGIVSGNSNVSGAVGEANMIWGAHAPSRARDGASPSRTFPFQSIAARRRNEHARRVRSPDSLATHC